MFRNATTEAGEIEQGSYGRTSADLISLSVLQLDLAAPAEGWPAYLSSRDIAVVTDDLGRPSISRGDARQLFDERREAEARQREALAQQEQRAIEQDRKFRAQVWGGIRAELMP